MALLGGSVAPASSPASPHLVTSLPRLSRKRRMNFFDIANLLDSDGNLQNEMMVFAFAATMLSTIPILLGNEFDINVGLKRKRREAGPYSDPDGDTVDSPHDSFTPGSVYETLMTTVEDAHTFLGHDKLSEPLTQEQSVDEPTDTWLNKLLHNLLQWSQKGSVKKSPFTNLITSLLHRYKSNPDDVNEYVLSIYEKWRKYWYQ